VNESIPRQLRYAALAYGIAMAPTFDEFGIRCSCHHRQSADPCLAPTGCRARRRF
jgi:hypothetical protein